MYTINMSTITLCSSTSFYKQLIGVQAELETLGYSVLAPAAVEEMKRSGNFDVSQYKTWFENEADYTKKSDLIRGHFKEIEKGDKVLVLNYEKNGKANYIGGNVLMEMAIAFYLNKPIYILNDVPEDSPFIEEIKAFGPTTLKGNLSLIT